jgi:hypothetical protein
LANGASKFSARHLQLLRVRVDPFCEGIVFCRRPSAFKLRAVFAFAIQLEVIVIGQRREFAALIVSSASARRRISYN